MPEGAMRSGVRWLIPADGVAAPRAADAVECGVREAVCAAGYLTDK